MELGLQKYGTGSNYRRRSSCSIVGTHVHDVQALPDKRNDSLPVLYADFLTDVESSAGDGIQGIEYRAFESVDSEFENIHLRNGDRRGRPEPPIKPARVLPVGSSRLERLPRDGPGSGLHRNRPQEYGPDASRKNCKEDRGEEKELR